MKTGKTVPPPPFPGAYWIIPGVFLAGPYPGCPVVGDEERRLQALLDIGIRSFVNLLNENEGERYTRGFAPYRYMLRHLAARIQVFVQIHRFPIPDMDIPRPRYMRKILDCIDRGVAQGEGVYLHCWGGLGRTGTVAGAFLARHGYARGQEALELLTRLRGEDPRGSFPSPETPEQRRFVINWPQGR